MPKNSNNKYQLFVFVLALLVLPHLVLTAELSFGAPGKDVSGGKPVEIGVFLSSDERINAFEGAIRFAPEAFQALEVRDGNSIVPLWIERPQIKKEDPGRITFSGIVPGGYSGRNAYLFSIVGISKKEGALTISAENLKAYLNDGAGTEAPLRVSPLELKVVSSENAAPAYASPKDTAPPEEFTPEVVQISTEPFNGRWVLVFSTTDKGSSVDRYEMQEVQSRLFRAFAPWRRVESPDVLRDQGRRSFLYLKAVDKAGNERMVTIAPRNPLAWYESYENWVIIVVGILALLLATKKLWRKKHI